MRRLALLLITLSAAVGAAALAIGSSAEGNSSSEFAVIFDDARGLIPGQLVKVAGATAGTITSVTVTPGFKARIVGTIDSRFMPFRQDATCSIRPEGLIAENYVDCDPGTLGSPVLRGVGNNPPTVPVSHTTEPVSLLDLFNMFNVPTQQRFQLIVNELGIGTAGRGDDFNSILLRANPTLALAREVISILDRQRNQLASIVDDTNTIARQAAGHTAALQRFLDRSASLTSLTAAHKDSLSQAVARLPGLLSAAEPAMRQLDTVAVDGTPLLAQLHVAAPALDKVHADLGPFVKAAKPGLASLDTALQTAIPAIRATTPLVSELATYTSKSLPGTLQFARLATNLQAHGFVENFLSIVYYIQAAVSRFDKTSHLLSILLIGPQNGACGTYTAKPLAGCSAHYFDDSSPKYKAQSAALDTATALRPASTTSCPRRGRGCAAGRAAGRAAVPASRSASGSAPAPQTSSSSSGSGPSAPAVSGPVAAAAQQAAAAVGGAAGAAAGPVAQSTKTLQSLVNYLIK